MVNTVIYIIFIGSLAWIFLIEALKFRRIRNLIKSLPISKIANLSLHDFVAIEGRVFAQQPEMVTAPLSGKKCAAFHWEIINPDNDKFAFWSSIGRFYSTHKLYLRDQSGGVAIIDLSRSEELDNTNKAQLFSLRKTDLTQETVLLLEYIALKMKLKKSKMMTMQIKETCFNHGDLVYAYGEVYPVTHIIPEAISIHLSHWERIKRKFVRAQITVEELKQFGLESFVPTEKVASVVISKSKNSLTYPRKTYVGFVSRVRYLRENQWAFLFSLVGSFLSLAWLLLEVYSSLKRSNSLFWIP